MLVDFENILSTIENAMAKASSVSTTDTAHGITVSEIVSEVTGGVGVAKGRERWRHREVFTYRDGGYVGWGWGMKNKQESSD